MPENRASFKHYPKTFATFEQPKKDTKYLQFLSKSYYFIWKYRGKVIKFNLKTADLYKAHLYRNTILLSLQSIRRTDTDEFNIVGASSLTIQEALRFIRRKIRDINMDFLDEIKSQAFDDEYWEQSIDEDLDEIMDLYNRLGERQKLKLKERMEYVDSFSIPSLNDEGGLVYLRPENYQYSKSVEEEEKMPTLRKAYDEWFNYKKNIDKVSNSSLKAYTSAFKYLTLFVGEDKKIDTFITKDFKIIQRHLVELPANTFKFQMFQNKSVREILEMNEIEQTPTLNNKTINNHCKNYKAMFDYFVYEEYIDKNPVQLRSLDEQKSDRTSFDDEDIVKLFTEIKEQELKDVMKISLYTGMRISEILLLEKSNIKDDIISIGQGKTDNAPRKIYIHDKIKETINHYKQTNDGSYLILDGNVNRVGKLINRRIQFILNDDRKTFHSFRKRFTKELLTINDRRLEYIQKILGHSISQTAKMTTETYGGEFEVPYEFLKAYIASIGYTFDEMGYNTFYYL